ncbi:MAG TPA: DnaA regulatory inactivator Hda [Rhodanobacteraceae bacterium]|nr:DnaA regulatory inactivator Hda [Rhodanobacteraceae bacterium]
MKAQQLPLSLRWPSHQRLDAFIAGANAHALDAVRALADGRNESWLYLHGPRGSGKTHLLIGACRSALESGRNARYLPLNALDDSRAEAIASFGAERDELLAIDDVQAVMGDADSERALFDLYNRAREAHAMLLFAAAAPPNQLGLQLPDLVSRLSACTQHALLPLDETGRREVLRMRAQQRGLQIDDAVLDWLFARQPRDLAALMELFERLDHAALAAQRRITIPFLREMLGGTT